MGERRVSNDKSGEVKKRRLKELAVEASRHLDEILPGGDESGVGNKLAPSGTPRAGDESAAGLKRAPRAIDASAGDSRRASPPGRTPDPGTSRPSVVTPERTASASQVRAESAVTVAATSRSIREAGRKHWELAGSKAGGPSALVAHVSHGVAKVLANLLTHMGVNTTVATSVEEVRSHLHMGPWDMLFVQGAARPYPGAELASLVLDRCSQSRPCVVLLTRPGDTLLAEAGTWNAVGLLQWPFSAAGVSKILAEIVPKARSSPSD